MSGQKVAYGPGLMGRQIVTDDMELFALGLIGDDIGKKGHELRTGVPRYGLAQDFAGFGVEGGIQRERAVAVILKSMAVGATWR